ncbi:hypothetical protein TIFTF001_000723 [Ficus carica]|uniref:Uncharacterized protein n=1 Tax=Ficus carica TaxID=3494 RepID=A0AA88CNP1_FICCA|nr:hypothetical protein TIFTF001_000723 [Ficus carica]
MHVHDLVSNHLVVVDSATMDPLAVRMTLSITRRHTIAASALTEVVVGQFGECGGMGFGKSTCRSSRSCRFK